MAAQSVGVRLYLRVTAVANSSLYPLTSYINNMQDFDELKKLKAQCIADIREALPLYANRLNSIDERLMQYIEDAISNEGSHSRSTSGRLLPARLCRLLL